MKTQNHLSLAASLFAVATGFLATEAQSQVIANWDANYGVTQSSGNVTSWASGQGALSNNATITNTTALSTSTVIQAGSGNWTTTNATAKSPTFSANGLSASNAGITFSTTTSGANDTRTALGTANTSNSTTLFSGVKSVVLVMSIASGNGNLDTLFTGAYGSANAAAYGRLSSNSTTLQADTSFGTTIRYVNSTATNSFTANTPFVLVVTGDTARNFVNLTLGADPIFTPFSRNIGATFSQVLLFNDNLTVDQVTGISYNLAQSWDIAGLSATSGQIAAADALGVVVIPEPTTWAMLAFGLATMIALRRRRQA